MTGAPWSGPGSPTCAPGLNSLHEPAVVFLPAASAGCSLEQPRAPATCRSRRGARPHMAPRHVRGLPAAPRCPPSALLLSYPEHPAPLLGWTLALFSATFLQPLQMAPRVLLSGSFWAEKQEMISLYHEERHPRGAARREAARAHGSARLLSPPWPFPELPSKYVSVTPSLEGYGWGDGQCGRAP